MREIHSPVAETPCILHKLLLRSPLSFSLSPVFFLGEAGRQRRLRPAYPTQLGGARPVHFTAPFFFPARVRRKKTHTHTSRTHTTDATGKFCAQSVRTVVLHVVLFSPPSPRHTTLSSLSRLEKKKKKRTDEARSRCEAGAHTHTSLIH